MAISAIIPLAPNRVWRTYLGGRMLDQLAGKPDAADTHFPEDWIASTTRAVNKGREHLTEEGLSRVTVDGRELLLRDLITESPDALVGRAHFAKYGAQTGFLLKFLDSSIRLHIQCHPTIPFAKQFCNSNSGKTEGYVILQTRPEIAEPYIYLGFQRPPRPEAFRSAILEQRVDEILRCFDKIRVRPGDVFLVPGGLPHAIGEGVFMVEIMEPTDLAVRIEFERGGYVLPEASRFMGRDVDFALSMFDFTPRPVEDLRRTLFGVPRLVRQYNAESSEVDLIDERLTQCFNVRRLTVKGTIEKREPGFYVAIVSKGSGAASAAGQTLPLKFGDHFLVPAATESVRFESKEGMELTLALPPK